MSIINAAITAVGGYLPEDKLTNADLEKLVDTNDEWITTRVGIKERRVLKDPTKGAAYLGVQAVQDLLSRSGIDPKTIDGLILTTNTGDHTFPTTASIVAHDTGCVNAFTFDLVSACPGFIYALETGANYIRSGRYKRVLVVAAEKMTAFVDYTDRATCPLFGDGAGCVLLEPTEEACGVMDASAIMERNGLADADVAWVVPHQANLRIIDAVAREMKVPMERVMVNIEYRGNTSSATIPLCLWEFEKKLHKGDNLILTSFGAGFTWGAVYVKWAYEPKH